MFYESVHYLGGTSWPIFSLLEHGKSLRRHGFDLDFTETELLHLVYRNQGPWLQSLSEDQHLSYLDIYRKGWRPKFAEVIRVIQETTRGLETYRNGEADRFL